MPNILLVDDDTTLRTIMVRALSRPERRIDVVDHGEAALERVAILQPDLIITDVMMPRMDGWTFVRRLRASAATAFIPVIFMTALSTTSDRLQGFRIGADDYLSKPVDLDELELRVQSLLRRTRTTRNVALSGDLSQFGLATPLTILDLEHKTGVLTVERASVRAQIAIRDGRVVHASMAHLTGLDCVCELLSWTSGRFSFEERGVDVSDDLQKTTSAILLTAACRIDESIPVDFG